MTIKMGMRISLGTNLRIAETAIFDPIRTAVAAIPIPTPFVALVETARVGQSPIHCTKVAFSSMIPFFNMRSGFMLFAPSQIFPPIGQCLVHSICHGIRCDRRS